MIFVEGQWHQSWECRQKKVTKATQIFVKKTYFFTFLAIPEIFNFKLFRVGHPRNHDALRNPNHLLGVLRCSFGNVYCLCVLCKTFLLCFPIFLVHPWPCNFALHLDFKPKSKTWLTRRGRRWLKRSSRFLAAFSSPLFFSQSGPICMFFFPAKFLPSSLPRYSWDWYFVTYIIFSFFLLSFLLPEQKYSFQANSFPPLSSWFLLLLVPKKVPLYSEMNSCTLVYFYLFWFQNVIFDILICLQVRMFFLDCICVFTCNCSLLVTESSK